MGVAIRYLLMTPNELVLNHHGSHVVLSSPWCQYPALTILTLQCPTAITTLVFVIPCKRGKVGDEGKGMWSKRVTVGGGSG